MMPYRQLAVIGVFILACFFRFWQFDQRIGIGYDGSRDALVAFESLRQAQLPLTGSFSSIGPIPFGPWYYWYITAAAAVIPFPSGPWMSIALASVGLVCCMFFIGTLLTNRQVGLAAALLAALSPAQILAGAQLQQHALVGFLSGLAMLLCLVLTRRISGPLAFLWGLVHGVALLVHYQAAGMLLLPVLFFILYRRWKLFFPFIGGLFCSAVPTLLFELNNHWFTTRNILDYIFVAQYSIWTSNRWLTFAGTFFPDFWSYVIGLPAMVCSTLSVAGSFLLISRASRREFYRPWILVIFTFLFQVVMLRYYRGEKFFGYLQFFHPFLFLFTGYLWYRLMQRFPNRLYRIVILCAVIAAIVPRSMEMLQSNTFNRLTARRADTLYHLFPTESFSLYKCKDIYDTNNVQGLLVRLHMDKRWGEHGRKITVYNKHCPIGTNKPLDEDLVEISATQAADLARTDIEPVSPSAVWADTARWWFKEQP